MSLSYQEVKQLRPASLQQASAGLSAAVTKLATEHTQYKVRVVDPLKGRHGWRGGGQPDAAAVAEVNGLAIDTTRLYAAAGAAAYTYAFAGFTLAQVYLTALETKVRHGKMRITELGSVVDDHDPNSVQRTRCQVQLQKILDYATKVDRHAASALNKGHEPPVTGLKNQPGLLERARADNTDAARDARRAVESLRNLGEDAAKDLPDLRDQLQQELGLPSYSVQVPPGAPASAAVGALFMVIGLRMGVHGAELLLGSGGVLSLEGGISVAGGAAVAGVGVLLVRNAGLELSQLQISQTNDNSGDENGEAQKLNDLLQQAKELEHEAQPGYRGGSRATVEPKKYDYLFGKVESSEHNAGRSVQNQRQLARVGVHDNPEGRELLREHFDEVAESDSSIVRTYTDRHGTFEVRDSLFAGPGGFLHFETTWQVTSNGLRLTTAIPYGGP